MSTSTSNSAFCIETATPDLIFNDLDPILNDLNPDITEALFRGKDRLENPIRITPNKDNDHSTANPEPMLEISGSTSGLESGTLAPQEKHDPSNADAELLLANVSATSCPKPLPLPTKEVNKMKRPEISASYKVTSAPPNSSKKRKSTSDVWNHFIKETDQNGSVRAKCQHCGKDFSGSSKDGTTHLKNHLNSSKCKRSQKETGGLENPTVTNGNFVFDEERSGLDLVRMFIKNNAKEQNYGAIKSANNVLKAQHAELTDRLRSLNSVLQMTEEMSRFSVDILEIPDSMMNPWQLNRPIQPIMADMFLP